jgi:large subunit ribosomal protein L22
MEAVAKLRNVPTSPRKMRLVADLVRGKQVNSALGLLKFEANSGAEKIEKLLLSALSNWQAKNEDLRVEDSNLYIKQIFVDEGKTLKRLRPAPQGRGHRIRKRSNHVTLIIDTKSEEEMESKQAKKAAFANSTKEASAPKVKKAATASKAKKAESTTKAK